MLDLVQTGIKGNFAYQGGEWELKNGDEYAQFKNEGDKSFKDKMFFHVTKEYFHKLSRPDAKCLTEF